MMMMMMMSLNKAWRSALLTKAFRQVGACGGDSGLMQLGRPWLQL